MVPKSNRINSHKTPAKQIAALDPTRQILIAKPDPDLDLMVTSHDYAKTTYTCRRLFRANQTFDHLPSQHPTYQGIAKFAIRVKPTTNHPTNYPNGQPPTIIRNQMTSFTIILK